MMTDKAKRKGNPRRRLLVQLMIGIGLIVALVSVGIYTLRPTGAQIVFIAPDNNGIDQIWIADLNNPENPRQLTFFEYPKFITGLYTSANNDTVIISLIEPDSTTQIAILNIVTGEQNYIPICQRWCELYGMNSDGNWLAYVSGESVLENNLYIYNLLTDANHQLDANESYWNRDSSLALSWIGDTMLLTFRTNNREQVVYSIEEDRVIDTLEAKSGFVANFSDDGSLYSFTQRHSEVIQTVSVRDRLNPSNTIFSLEMNEFIGERTFANVLDWHPNNQAVLVTETRLLDGDMAQYELSLYVLNENNSQEILVSNDAGNYVFACFNHDVSLVLFNTVKRNISIEEQIMIYDMDTGEEIALPLFGRSPQWVNGGR